MLASVAASRKLAAQRAGRPEKPLLPSALGGGGGRTRPSAARAFCLFVACLAGITMVISSVLRPEGASWRASFDSSSFSSFSSSPSSPSSASGLRGRLTGGSRGGGGRALLKRTRSLWRWASGAPGGPGGGCACGCEERAAAAADGAEAQEPMRARRAVLGVVGIQTGFGSAQRREALRATWMASSPAGLKRLERESGLVFRFILGQSEDPRAEASVRREMAAHRDFLRIDVLEHYNKLNQKTFAFLRTVFALYDAQFYVKADDDIYLRPDRLGVLLARDRPSEQTYLGCMKKGPVVADPRLKWFEPQGHLIGSEYFLHAYGPIYALSKDVVATLVAARAGGLRMFMNEDVTVGAWMLGLNVTYEDNRALCETACGPHSIAVWDLPTCSGLCDAPKRLVELHALDLCSKSPTLPDD